MTLLEFASGPGMQWALWIFVFGVVWRLIGAVFLLSRKDLTKPREYNSVAAGVGAILSRSTPAHAFEKKIRFQHFTGYLWHFALFVSVLFFAPHILFFKSVLGFG